MPPRSRTPLANRPLTVAAGGALLVFYSLWAYCNSFVAPFVFDDVSLIYENPALLHYWPATSLGERRFVAHLTFAFNRQVGGLAPIGYHALNIAIHAAAALVLFGLARRTLLLPGVPAKHARVATFLAFAIALLWAVHPLQTEAVTYVIQRLESLACLFYLLLLYGLVRAATSPRPIAWHAVSLAACWLGLATKEIVVTAPLVALLYDRVYLSSSWREVWQRRGMFYLACLPPLVWVLSDLIPEVSSTDRSAVGLGVPNVTPTTYLLTQSEVLTHYLKLVFVPTPLCIDYNWMPARSFAEVWPSFLFIAALLGLSLFSLWRWPRVGFLGMAFFLVLAPTSSVVPLADAAFEHRMYLPLAAVLTLLVLAAREVWRRVFAGRPVTFPRKAWANRADVKDRAARAEMVRRVLAVALIHFTSQALLVRTLARNKEYGSYVAIWRSAVEASPKNPRARINLGGAYYLTGETDAAIEQLRESLRAAPSPQAFTYLGLIARDGGDAKLARRFFERALEVDPRFSPPQVRLGLLEEQQGNLPAAADRYRLAVKLAPNYAPTYWLLGRVELKQNLPRAARDDFEAGLALWPEHPDLLADLTLLLATSREAEVFDPPAAAGLAARLEPIMSRRPNVEGKAALAAARAANHDFIAAAEFALSAAELAEEAGNEKQALALRARAKRYAAGEVVYLP